jgi:hypothetical protein
MTETPAQFYPLHRLPNSFATLPSGVHVRQKVRLMYNQAEG